MTPTLNFLLEAHKGAAFFARGLPAWGGIESTRAGLGLLASSHFLLTHRGPTKCRVAAIAAWPRAGDVDSRGEQSHALSVV